MASTFSLCSQICRPGLEVIPRLATFLFQTLPNKFSGFFQKDNVSIRQHEKKEESCPCRGSTARLILKGRGWAWSRRGCVCCASFPPSSARFLQALAHLDLQAKAAWALPGNLQVWLQRGESERYLAGPSPIPHETGWNLTRGCHSYPSSLRDFHELPPSSQHEAGTAGLGHRAVTVKSGDPL